MPPASVSPTKNSEAEHGLTHELPQFPGEDFLAHEGSLWLEAAEARLAARKLLAVANGSPPPGAKAIIDVDLTSLPPLPPTHRDYNRRLETRIKVQTTNRENDEKRLQITLDAWTELYTLLKK